MTSTKTVEDFPVGTKVVFDLDGITVHGSVESIQLQKKLVDVKIYEPGHRSHCLIVARPPETLYGATDDDGPSSYADLQKRVEGAQLNKDVLAKIDDLGKGLSELGGLITRLSSVESSVSALSSRVTSLESAVSMLQARVATLEANPGGQAEAAQ